MPLSPEITLLLQTIDQAFNLKAWHGPNLRGALRGLTAAEAGWRAPGGGHTIAELAVHAAYWKYAVRRKLQGEAAPRGGFPRKGSNWFRLPDPLPPEEWKAILALLDEQHRQLRDAVAAIPPAALSQKPPGTKYTRAFLAEGIALHDVYHAGQVRQLKAWQARR